MNQCREIAIAIQRKTRLKVRVQPGQDRISVKGRDGVWKDYTADEGARAFGLKGYLKPGAVLVEPALSPDATAVAFVVPPQAAVVTERIDVTKTRKPRAKKDK